MAVVVKAPMVGRVLEVKCKIGDAVTQDQIILLLESMKMEVPVFAPVSGAISEVKALPGQTVDSDSVLAVIESV